MTKTPWNLLGLAVGMFAAGCAAPKSAPTAVPPTPTPTPSLLSRTNPNIVEEDDVHFVERFPKEKYIRVDDHHFRNPVIGPSAEFYKEDDKYFYVYTYKRTAEMQAVAALQRGTPTPAPHATPAPAKTPSGPSPAEFEDLSPARGPSRLHLERVAAGLPKTGLWRSSFVVADVNGDGIPDIVAPPSRLEGGGSLHVWLGDGKGHFTAWPMHFTENGKPASLPLDYGAVAVGDIDGDGHPDVVTVSHSGGLVSLFGDGHGNFRIVRAGLPGREYSGQAIALLDADGDGKLDIVTSTDTPSRSDSQDQVRVYLYRGEKGWEYKQDAILGAFFSNSVTAWDFDGDGKKDILTASNIIGALTLLWRNTGGGKFVPAPVDPIEIYAYHFATAPGTFGKDRQPAFADAYYMITNEPVDTRAAGISLYSYDKEKKTWSRHRVWRKKGGQTAQYALAMGDLDGDGLDDIVFADSDVNRLRVFFQKPDGTFVEMPERDEPTLDSPGQCVRLVDLDGDGRLDIVLTKTIASYRPDDPGGWEVFLNKK